MNGYLIRIRDSQINEATNTFVEDLSDLVKLMNVILDNNGYYSLEDVMAVSDYVPFGDVMKNLKKSSKPVNLAQGGKE